MWRRWGWGGDRGGSACAIERPGGGEHRHADDADGEAGHEPVAYLRLHSDADDVIPYEGNARMPSAATCIARWRETNSCAEEVSEERLDLDGHNHGAESIDQRSEGCDATAGVHLMTMVGSGHVPQLTPSAQRLLLKLLMTYRR